MILQVDSHEILPSHDTPFHLICEGLRGAKHLIATFFSGHDAGGPLPGVGVEKGRLDGVDVFFVGLDIIPVLNEKTI